MKHEPVSLAVFREDLAHKTSYRTCDSERENKIAVSSDAKVLNRPYNVLYETV